MTLTNSGRSKVARLQRNMGSVSCGTMKPEDLIPSFLSELESQKPLRKEHKKLALEIATRITQGEDYFGTDDSDYDLEALFDALNEYCLPYFSFGSNPGDGADFGYWLSEDFRQQFEDDGGLVVNDTSEIPKGYVGEVLHVSDHGNMTLYVKSTRKLREIWAIV